MQAFQDALTILFVVMAFPMVFGGIILLAWSIRDDAHTSYTREQREEARRPYLVAWCAVLGLMFIMFGAICGAGLYLSAF